MKVVLVVLLVLLLSSPFNFLRSLCERKWIHFLFSIMWWFLRLTDAPHNYRCCIRNISMWYVVHGACIADCSSLHLRYIALWNTLTPSHTSDNTYAVRCTYTNTFDANFIFFRTASLMASVQERKRRNAKAQSIQLHSCMLLCSNFNECIELSHLHANQHHCNVYVIKIQLQIQSALMLHEEKK